MSFKKSVYDVDCLTHKEDIVNKKLSIQIGQELRIDIEGNYKIKNLDNIDCFFPKIKEVKVSVDYSWFFFIYLTLKIDDFNIYLYKKTKITIYDNNNIVFEKSI
jgi:hypothetical protein|tara:strand:- start:60 stop:371 length:312 start_codon:yes stop_codon:yes gene_type:complete